MWYMRSCVFVVFICAGVQVHITAIYTGLLCLSPTHSHPHPLAHTHLHTHTNDGTAILTVQTHTHTLTCTLSHTLSHTHTQMTVLAVHIHTRSLKHTHIHTHTRTHKNDRSFTRMCTHAQKTQTLAHKYNTRMNTPGRALLTAGSPPAPGCSIHHFALTAALSTHNSALPRRTQRLYELL